MTTTRRRFLKGIAALGGLSLVGPLCWLDERPKRYAITDPGHGHILPEYATGGILPVGSILTVGSGSTAFTLPPGFLFCDGQQICATEYGGLVDILGTSYVPDFRSRLGDGSVAYEPGMVTHIIKAT